LTQGAERNTRDPSDVSLEIIGGVGPLTGDFNIDRNFDVTGGAKSLGLVGAVDIYWYSTVHMQDRKSINGENGNC
jgi:hypothetical protein